MGFESPCMRQGKETRALKPPRASSGGRAATMELCAQIDQSSASFEGWSTIPKGRRSVRRSVEARAAKSSEQAFGQTSRGLPQLSRRLAAGGEHDFIKSARPTAAGLPTGASPKALARYAWSQVTLQNFSCRR